MANQPPDHPENKPPGSGWIDRFVLSANTWLAFFIAVITAALLGNWLGWFAGVIAFFIVFPIALAVFFFRELLEWL